MTDKLIEYTISCIVYMIKRISATEADKEKLATLKINPETQKDDFFDYSKTLIKKPWGHEYLVFKNENVAVWALHIKKGFQTSLHCHPQKETSIVVLSGEALCKTLGEEHKLTYGKGLFLDRGVFHSTKALSPEGILVMETETPTNKKDLVRLDDAYGREGEGYESKEHFSELNEAEFAHFHNEEEKYHCDKKFGKCSIVLSKHESLEDFKNTAKDIKDGVATILKGSLYNSNKEKVLKAGDVVGLDELKNIAELTSPEEVEFLLVKPLTS